MRGLFSLQEREKSLAKWFIVGVAAGPCVYVKRRLSPSLGASFGSTHTQGSGAYTIDTSYPESLTVASL